MSAKRDMDVDDYATIFEGLAHAVRMTIHDCLRENGGSLTLAELRKLVSERYMETDHRSIEFHVTKMQFCGLVRLHQVEGKKVATLLLEIALPKIKTL